VFNFQQPETLVFHFSAKYKKLISLLGNVYISENYICFLGSGFGKEFSMKLEVSKIKSVKSNLSKKLVQINSSNNTYKFYGKLIIIFIIFIFISYFFIFISYFLFF
jgi:hypothetical protein